MHTDYEVLMRKTLLISFVTLFSLALKAQDGSSVFNFLKLPISSHAAGLGGENISIIEDDLTMALHNPALLSCVSDKMLNLNYMIYLDGVGVANAAFSRTINNRSAWAIAAQFLEYGKMKHTDPENNILGEFSAKDMAFMGIYNYDLSDYWSGGVNAKFIYSNYEAYSSFAIGVDLGLNYYDQSSDFSASLAVKNLGGQIVRFDDTHEKLPIDVQLGISKRLAHAPFRASITMVGLHNWDSSPNNTGKKDNFAKILLNHFVVGLDFLPSENLFVSLGYNCRRGAEMKINDSSHWAGLTLGAGIQIKRIKLGGSFAKYHTVGSSLLFNLGMVL